MKKKPNCFLCKWRGNLPYDSHSECNHPLVTSTDKILCPLASAAWGIRSGAMKRLNISGNAHGIKNGWFSWPLNFDPIWIETCDGFEPIEPKKENNENKITESSNAD